MKNPTSPPYCHISHRKKGLPSVCMLLKSETMHWKQPKAIIDHFGNISSLNDYFYSFNIITSQGDNPVIMTNNGAFMPSGLINDQSFIYEGDTFNPTDAVYMLTDAVYYVSNGKIYSYNSGLLYRAAKHDKKNITGAIRLLPILMYMFSMN